jgi:hypothetical protein
MARTWEMSALVASIEFFADGSRYSGGQLRSILHLPMSARWPTRSVVSAKILEALSCRLA